MYHHPKGSLWRKWDLHFHTPASFDYKNKGVTNQQIIDRLVAEGIRVVAITDHHVMDVDRILELQRLGEGRVTVLPGIEFRSELGGKESVHYIGIFSEKTDVKELWEELRVQLKLASKLRKGGDEHLWISIWDAEKVIHDLGGLISIHAGRKSNSIENIPNKTLFQQAIKTDILTEGIVDILELGRPGDLKDYEEIVFPEIQEYLPTIICSDNHDINGYRTKANCWIRADPCFYGLQQTLVEPQDRIFIGEKPPKRIMVSQNRTNYIRTIKITKSLHSTLKDKWFDNVELDLNHDLVAIIGNKGSGKSALVEAIGLLGNTHNNESFSFLTSDRFRNKKNNLASHFEAEIIWEDDQPVTLGLDEDPNLNALERVTCIPQGLFEDICNDTEAGPANKFNQELRKVIFSHVPEPERLGKESLDALLEHLTDETNDAIEILKGRLHETNKKISEIEEQLTEEYRKQLEDRKKNKKNELASHNRAKPAEVSKPEDSDEESNKAIRELTKEISDLDNKINRTEEKISQYAELLSTAKKVLSSIDNFKERFNDFKLEIGPGLQSIEVNFDDIVTFSINDQPISKKVKTFEDEKTKLERLIDPDVDDSLTKKKNDVDVEFKKLKSQLDEASQEYENYLLKLQEWKRKKQEIIGAKDIPDTLQYYEHKLASLDDELKSELKVLKDNRLKIVEQIYEKILDLVKIYRKLYAPVQRFSETYKNKSFALTFDVSIVDQGLEDNFFDWIARNVIGSFYGSEEGKETLHNIIEKHDFNSWEGVSDFLHDLSQHLTEDKRQGKTTKTNVATQLRKGKAVSDFYDFIFSLDYLRPRYVLKLDGKELTQLSPGERGALLLVFYLLVDKARIPLIIDQPEENLDNQTVFNQLVDAIKEAKKRRQIIIVTHNPNIAVVCDAEQVIVCSIDKADGHRIEYVSGAIENPDINHRIIDILEGTQPAFTNRRLKYAPFLRK